MNRELPFAGHPNVGTAFVLATLAAKAAGAAAVRGGRRPRAGRDRDRAGQGRQHRIHRAAAAEADVASWRRTGRGLPLAVGGDVKTDRHPPQIISVGLSFLAVEVASREALRRARPDAAAFAKTFPCDGSDAVYFYTRDVPASEKPCELQARMFHPGASGLSEDPATGSATAACAALLADLDDIKDGELRLKIGQGVDMGRPSLLLTRVRKQNGAVASIHVGGGSVKMMEGTFRLAGEG